MQLVKPAANTHTATEFINNTKKIHLQLRLTWLNTAVPFHSSVVIIFVVHKLFYM